MTAKCEGTDKFSQAVNTFIAKGDMESAQAVLSRDKTHSLQQGGMQEYLIPTLASLSPATATQVRYDSSGVWLYLAKSGTTPGAEFTVEMAGGKSFTKVVPGTFIKGTFEGFLLTTTGANVGVARFIIGQNDNVGYSEWDIADGAGQSAALGAIVNISQGAVAFAAPPSGAAQAGAVPIKNARGVRALIRCPGNSTAGSIRWWVYEPTVQGGLWYASPAVESVVVGNTSRMASSDFEVGVMDGLVYAELFGNTSSSAGSWEIQLQVL